MTPFLQAQLGTALQEGGAELGLDLDASQRNLLLRYLALIEQWNRVYNLTAVRDPVQMLTQHLLDSLAAVASLRRQIAAHAWAGRVSVLDVGSGAGLPGVAIAVACPEVSVTCVDAVGKKAGFVRQVAGELGLLEFAVLHSRVESIPSRPWQIIVSRAFSSLSVFTDLTAPLLSPGGIWLAMKGKTPEEEIRELPGSIEVFHVEPLSVPGLKAERCLVWMQKRGFDATERRGTATA